MAQQSMVTVHLVGLPEFDRAVEAMLLRVQAGTAVGVHEAGKAVVKAIQGHMDGRPGPNRVTGNLYRSLRSDPVQSVAGGWGRAIYPDGSAAPYARRIELGFVGADSRGRVYNQPPYPYFAPGLEDAIASGAVLREMVTVWRKALT